MVQNGYGYGSQNTFHISYTMNHKCKIVQVKFIFCMLCVDNLYPATIYKHAMASSIVIRREKIIKE